MISLSHSFESDPPPLIISDRGCWEFLQAITSNNVDHYQNLLLAEPALACWVFITEQHGNLRSLTAGAEWLYDHADLLVATVTKGEFKNIEESKRAPLVDLLTRCSAAAKEIQSDEDQWTALISYLALGSREGADDRFDWLKEINDHRSIENMPPDDECLQRWRDESWVVNDAFAVVGAAQLRSRQIEADFQETLEVEKLASLKQLAYGASHEVNNPLANIATRAQTLLRDESHPDRSRALEVIYEQAMRAHEMISNMMVYAHPPAPEHTSCNVVKIIAQVIVELAELSKREQTVISLHETGEIPNALIDSTQFAMAIKAVLQNSIEASPLHGEIEIALPHHGGGPIVISIRNQGPLIAPEIRRHMFDPFFSGREAGRGLGFGLSTARVLLEQNNAAIKYHVDENGGRFIISAPIAEV